MYTYRDGWVTLQYTRSTTQFTKTGMGEMKFVKANMLLVLFPDPNPCTGNGLVTLEQFLGCTGTAMLCNQSRASCTLLCNGMQIIEPHSDWLELNQDSCPCTALLLNWIQNHMKILELLSDWFMQKHNC